MKRKLLLIIFLLAAALPLKAASTISTSLSGVRAYPNPWRADKHANTTIKIDTMPAGSKSLVADSNGTAPWDRTNDSGELVASGVYIYLVIDPQGNEASGKLAIIK